MEKLKRLRLAEYDQRERKTAALQAAAGRRRQTADFPNYERSFRGGNGRLYTRPTRPRYKQLRCALDELRSFSCLVSSEGETWKEMNYIWRRRELASEELCDDCSGICFGKFTRIEERSGLNVFDYTRGSPKKYQCKFQSTLGGHFWPDAQACHAHHYRWLSHDRL